MMKKLTAGIFATILGLTAIGAAEAATPVATTGYVKGAIESLNSNATVGAGKAIGGFSVEHGKVTEVVPVDIPSVDGLATQDSVNTLGETVTALDSAVKTNATNIKTLQDGMSNYALSADLDSLGTTVNNMETTYKAADEALGKRIDDVVANAYDDTVVKGLISANTEAINGKQDKLTAAEQAAVSSGITEALVSQYSGYDARITSAADQAAAAVDAAAAAANKADAATTAADAATTAADAATTAANTATSTANAARDAANTATSTANAANAAATKATSDVAALTTTVGTNTASIATLTSDVAAEHETNVAQAQQLDAQAGQLTTLSNNKQDKFTGSCPTGSTCYVDATGAIQVAVESYQE